MRRIRISDQLYCKAVKARTKNFRFYNIISIENAASQYSKFFMSFMVIKISYKLDKGTMRHCCISILFIEIYLNVLEQ